MEWTGLNELRIGLNCIGLNPYFLKWTNRLHMVCATYSLYNCDNTYTHMNAKSGCAALLYGSPIAVCLWSIRIERPCKCDCLWHLYTVVVGAGGDGGWLKWILFRSHIGFDNIRYKLIIERNGMYIIYNGVKCVLPCSITAYFLLLKARILVDILCVCVCGFVSDLYCLLDNNIDNDNDDDIDSESESEWKKEKKRNGTLRLFHLTANHFLIAISRVRFDSEIAESPALFYQSLTRLFCTKFVFCVQINRPTNRPISQPTSLFTFHWIESHSIFRNQTNETRKRENGDDEGKKKV